MLLYFARDGQERVREVDRNAAKYHLWGNAVLIRIRAEDETAPLLPHCVEHTQPGCVRVLEDHIHSARQLRERLLLAGADIVPVADVRGSDGDLWVHRACTGCERAETFPHWREFRATYDTNRIRASHLAGDHAREIRRLSEAEAHASNVGTGRVS